MDQVKHLIKIEVRGTRANEISILPEGSEIRVGEGAVVIRLGIFEHYNKGNHRESHRQESKQSLGSSNSGASIFIIIYGPNFHR